MSPARLRAYVLIVIRDIVVPLAGVFLSIYLPVGGAFAPWQLPLLAGMIGVPLVGRGGDAPEDQQSGSEA